MCPISGLQNYPIEAFTCFGIKVFLLVWIVFVPIAVTSRLDKIVKLLQDKK